jgi:hypothetical protein
VVQVSRPPGEEHLFHVTNAIFIRDRIETGSCQRRVWSIFKLFQDRRCTSSPSIQCGRAQFCSSLMSLSDERITLLTYTIQIASTARGLVSLYLCCPDGQCSCRMGVRVVLFRESFGKLPKPTDIRFVYHGGYVLEESWKRGRQ